MSNADDSRHETNRWPCEKCGKPVDTSNVNTIQSDNGGPLCSTCASYE